MQLFHKKRKWRWRIRQSAGVQQVQQKRAGSDMVGGKVKIRNEMFF
jgi:hypothetical protein